MLDVGSVCACTTARIITLRFSLIPTVTESRPCVKCHLPDDGQHRTPYTGGGIGLQWRALVIPNKGVPMLSRIRALTRVALLLAASVTLFLSTAHAAEAVCTAVADVATGKSLKQEGACTQRVTPASTFKIAISLMGYDSGFLVNEHVPALPFHKGYPDWNPSWRVTTDPTSWIKNSVVSFSQQVTGSLGVGRFQQYVSEFHYGNEDVSGDPQRHDGLTQAWLSSSLQISPLEQLLFLRKVVQRQLPVSARAYDMTSRITAICPRPLRFLSDTLVDFSK